jgi:hypothetical protein
MGLDRLQTMMTTRSTLRPHSHGAQGQVGVINRYKNIPGLDAMEPNDGSNRFPTVVHVGLRLAEHNALTHRNAFSNLCKELFLRPPGQTPMICQSVCQHESGIMSCIHVFPSRVTEACN